MRASGAVLVLACVLLAVCCADALSGTAVIHGRIEGLLRTDIHGRLAAFPPAEVTVTLFRPKWFGLSRSRLGECTAVTAAPSYRFAGLESGEYELEFVGPYTRTGIKTVSLEEGEELDIPRNCQPYPSKASVVAWLYAMSLMDPDNLPAHVAAAAPFIRVHNDLLASIDSAGDALIRGGLALSVSRSGAYERAVGMWQPGMPTEIPGDIAIQIQSVPAEMHAFGNTTKAIGSVLPDLMQENMTGYKQSDLYATRCVHARILHSSIQYQRSQLAESVSLRQLVSLQPTPTERELLELGAYEHLLFCYLFAYAHEMLVQAGM